MKVKVLSRDANEHYRETKSDLKPVSRNSDPNLHPFERAREYTRALNRVKLDKVFAKPYLGSLSGHVDGCYTLMRHPNILSCVISGGCDGEIIIWDVPNFATRARIPNAHRGIIRGITMGNSEEGRFLSASSDSTIKAWKFDWENPVADQTTPLATYVGDQAFTSIDHRRDHAMFATSGRCVELWDYNRLEPTFALEWGTESVTSVAWNRVETNVLAATASDCSVILYDINTHTPLHKVFLKMRSNAVSWSPMEAFNFVVANDDGNVYSFDMRRLDTALRVHEDHVSAVLDVDFSPTGKEFVSGSYDQTIRIFPFFEGRSREVYHTRRMQRIFSVKFSGDAKYVMSASDDMNIRLWKAKASEKLGAVVPRQKQKRQYEEKLKDRYKHMPEIRRIDKHRHVPKKVLVAKRTKTEHEQSQKRKEDNRRAHSAPGVVPHVAKQKKHIRYTKE